MTRLATTSCARRRRRRRSCRCCNASCARSIPISSSSIAALCADLADVRLFAGAGGRGLIGAFGALALLVASVGLYGVIGYSVSRRVREIGIRKALGARPSQLVGMVLGEGMVLVAIGGVVGRSWRRLVARVLSSVLFVDPFDVVSFGWRSRCWRSLR